MNTKAATKLAVIGLCFSASVVCGWGAGIPKTNLITFLSHWQASTGAIKRLTCELDPEWVGTVNRVYLRDPANIYGPEEPADIRFSHLFIASPPLSSNLQLYIIRGRVANDGNLGSYLGSEGPVFHKTLPSVESVSKAQTLADLEKLLGPRQGPSGGWGGPNGMHSTAGWTLFTTNGARSLRYLSVFAQISSSDRFQSATVGIRRVTEGYFRPADPNSRDEFEKYKTGEDDFAEYQRQKAEARAKFSQPLRSFLEARETPDDSDLNAYKRTLNAVRANPNPQLFRQLVEAMEGDTVTFKGYLEDILFDDWLKLEPWQSQQKKIAARALAEAIPYAKSAYALQHALILFLRTQGELGLRPDGNYILGGGRLPTEARQAPSEMYQEIKQRYPNVWAD